uniref:Putative secreted peptide n=1 Tax=Anopheles braziliensis TaxID=58242 RepID=A0A2M3ZPJ4_9DIPT
MAALAERNRMQNIVQLFLFIWISYSNIITRHLSGRLIYYNYELLCNTLCITATSAIGRSHCRTAGKRRNRCVVKGDRVSNGAIGKRSRVSAVCAL